MSTDQKTIDSFSNGNPTYDSSWNAGVHYGQSGQPLPGQQSTENFASFSARLGGFNSAKGGDKSGS